MKVKAIALAAFVTAAALVTVQAQTDPFDGAWKLNVAKSSYIPGPAPTSASVTISTKGTSVTVVVEGVSGTGEKVHWEYTAAHDGKPYKIVGNNPDADMISLKRISPRSVQTTNTLKGKATTTNVRTVSADGKTLTVTTTGVNAAGQTVNNRQVFEK